MVSASVSSVADPLKLVLLLIQRAVTRIHSERIPELKASGAVQRERGQAGGVIVVHVQAGDAGILGGRSAQSVRIDKNSIAEETEAEVGQPVRTDHVIEAICQALVAKRRGASEG